MNTIMDLSEINGYIGQLFMIGIPGPEFDKHTEYLIRDYNIGGIILFSRNIKDPLQLAKLCKDIQAVSLKYHGNRMFISIDQEGGSVARLKEPFTVFPGNEAIVASPDPEKSAKQFATVTAREMKMVGLNMDLAPVMDVKRGEPDRHLKNRIFSDDPEKVGFLGSVVIDTLQEKGIMAVAKHFPGLGLANFDPHQGHVTIRYENGETGKDQLLPFKKAVKQKVSGIMTSHALYPDIDPEYPGTLSHKILTGILREKLKFKGLILTDDLEMGAISKNVGVAQGAVSSFEAGADILLVCENRKNVSDSIDLLRKKLLKNEITMERLMASIDRIKAAKSLYLGTKKRISFAGIKKYFDLNV
ncbi:MAG: beta-N-acetylhexosaminidase [Desulfobacteraceae bacterium]